MTPYHVARSKLFVRERFGKTALIHLDTAEIEANIYSATIWMRTARQSG
jgi:hypothetical protein